MPKYYSKRNKPPDKNITLNFWRGFDAFIKEIIQEGMLSEYFGDWSYSSESWYVDNDRVNGKMLQEIGFSFYPINPLRMPNKDILFDLIEFFFRYVSKPSGDKFDAAKGKYAYTIGINRLFENFNLAYEIKKGVIKDLHSKILDRAILSDSFEIPDRETQDMLTLSLDKFYSRNADDKRIGLEKLVDVFQRISSWEDKDKKKSIEKILNKTCGGDANIKETLECELTTLWRIANDFMIRHTEIGKIPISDDDFREYLFYAYYNCIRLILLKYKYPKAPAEEEDIPF
jgi:hypothetical protein